MEIQIENIKWNFVLANSFCTSKVLFTDTSWTGCGGFIQGSALVCHKNWSAEESQKSSTWKELVAIYFAIEAFDNHLAGQTVACNTDNQNFVLIIQAGSMFEVIYQTRATVFHRDIQTPRRELKIRRAAEYF